MKIVVPKVLGKIESISTGWLLLVLFGLLLLRAWPRLFSPEVWDEDGTRNLPGFVTEGVAVLTKPVSGYLLLIPKLITVLSASISITFYPLISTLFAWVFILLTLALIAKAPIHLKGGFFLALFCLLIPSAPETFGLSVYTFWWSSLILFIFVFWKETSKDFWLRSLGIALSSLSSPVCLVTLPLFWGRVFFSKERATEIGLAFFASLFAGIQFYSMWPIAKGEKVNFLDLPEIIPVFLGNYTVGIIFRNLTHVTYLKWIMGSLTLGYVLIGFARNKSSWVLWILGYLWITSVLMSFVRVDIDIINPISAGPRYFFFPFIVLSWTLLQLLLIEKNRWMRGVGGCLLVLSIINAVPKLRWKHDHIDWTGHIYSCAQFPEYSIPIHYNGRASLVWDLTLKGSKCADVLNKDYLSKFITNKTYPYRVVWNWSLTGTSLDDLARNDLNIPESSRIKHRDWHGSDFYSATVVSSRAPIGYEIFGSFSPSNANTGELVVHLRRGENILFRAGSDVGRQRIIIVGQGDIFFDVAPTRPGWMILDFSNKLLPDEFDVKFLDAGDAPQEWSAIVLRKSVVN